jgi:hypothetical protein
LVNQTLQIMKTRFLFPYWCKFLGIGLFLVHLPVMLLKKQLGFDGAPAGDSIFNSNHLFFMVTTLTMLSGLVLIAFSKERIEDEQITQLRMDTLQLSIYLNYIVLIISLAFTNRNDFWDVMRVNMWAPLMFFILLFRWKLYRNNRFIKDDAI